MAEDLRDHQEFNESEVCDDVIAVPIPRQAKVSIYI